MQRWMHTSHVAGAVAVLYWNQGIVLNPEFQALEGVSTAENAKLCDARSD